MEIGAILLAAGRGTRLHPLTTIVPKSAIPLLDVPLAAYALPRLVAASPAVVVNASHLAATVASALAPYVPDPSLVEIFYERPEPLGSGGTVAALKRRVVRRVVTWNADTLSDLDPRALLDAHERSGALGTAAVTLVDRGADFELNGLGATRLVNRKRDGDVAGGLFLGAAVFERAALDVISSDPPVDLARGLLQPLIERRELAVFPHEGYACDVGTLERYLRASLDVLAGRAPQPAAGVAGDVVEVEGGRAFLGKAARAETTSLGPGAIVLAGATIEPQARIERSIVWPGESVPAGVELQDTVWAFGSALSPATPAPPA